MAGPWTPGTVDPHAGLSLCHEGYTVLVSRSDGTIGEGREGLFDFDTRILSRYRLAVGGNVPELLSGGALDACRWEGRLAVPREGRAPDGSPLPQDAVELVLARRVGRGMAERLELHNHAMAPLENTLTLELAADFADVIALGSRQRRPGRVRQRWDARRATLTFTYEARRRSRMLRRGLRLRVIGAAATYQRRNGATLRFALQLPPQGSWSVRLVFGSLLSGKWREPLPVDRKGLTRHDRARARWHAERTTLRSSSPLLTAAFERAAHDLIGLRAWDYDLRPGAWLPNAGVPTYTGIFGRDVLTAAWQAALLGPEPLRGALDRLAALQARHDSPWQDAEPGKLPHEVRRGPLAELDVLPQRAYYGEQTAPSLFVIALSEYWHWTADLGFVRRHLGTLRRIFAWAERYGDRDGDGLLEYTRRSRKGLKNQGWKDSDEALRYPDGTLVPNPIATLEEQAFHYLALSRMAELLLLLGDSAGADRFLARARALAERVDRSFWLEAEGYYAMALDPRKEPVASLASNPGHALATGLVPAGRARQVADRLLGPELFSGFGVRTLAATHPSFNPLAYHLGTIWPVENATFALGLKRYGLDEHADRLITGMLEAAGHFRHARLPEAFGGQPRDEAALPTVYPGANAPQAWSASAVILLVQTLLGLYPFARAATLALVRPRLPHWVDWVELRSLRVGRARVSLRFDRQEDGTVRHTVLEQRGTLRVISFPPPVDLSPELERWHEQLKLWAVEHFPGRLGRVLRIALGIER